MSQGAVLQSGLFLRRIHEKHVGESLFSTRQNEVPQKSHSMLPETGRPRALPWYADFSLARRLCWAWDAKQFGQTPAPSQKCSLPDCGGNMKCAPRLFPVPPTSSPHCKLDPGPATHMQPPGLIGVSLISRHPTPQKENPLALNGGQSQSQTQSHHSVTCGFTVSPC